MELAAFGWAQMGLKRLVRFKDIGGSPDRDGFEGHDAGVPVTDRGYWEDRWVLCPLRLELAGGEGLTFGDAVASVGREKRIVSTVLVGRDGSVKEYINGGDRVVSIVVGIQRERDGVISDEWPGDELRGLRRLLDAKEALNVYSEFLDAMGIDRIVVRSYSVKQMTESNWQGVEIRGVSDEDYEIFSDDYEGPKDEGRGVEL